MSQAAGVREGSPSEGETPQGYDAQHDSPAAARRDASTRHQRRIFSMALPLANSSTSLSR